jgi:hypothetical protein
VRRELQNRWHLFPRHAEFVQACSVIAHGFLFTSIRENPYYSIHFATLDSLDSLDSLDDS